MKPATGTNIRTSQEATIVFQRRLIWVLASFGLVVLLGLITAIVTSRVIVTPSEIRRPYEIGLTSSNPEYLVDMADQVLDRLLNVTPDNIDYRTRKVAEMLSPENYGEQKAMFDAAAARIKAEKISTVWSPGRGNSVVREKSRIVTIPGTLATYVGDTLTGQRPKTYAVRFTQGIDGRLQLVSVGEVAADNGKGPAPAPTKTAPL